jgi:DNA-binding NarL/FixJ family response regulator
MIEQQPLRLAIFEDNKTFRESLTDLFNFSEGIELVGVYNDGNDVRQTMAQIKPDVVLMDIDMPGMTGIEVTLHLKEVSPTTQVIMLTVSEEEDRIFQSLRNGATGYLLKKAGPDELVESVRSVSEGGSPITPAIARKVLQFFRSEYETIQKADTIKNIVEKPDENDDDDLSTGLTPREREILEGLVDGLSYKMIASRYFISADTVKNHIQGIYRKLHVNSKGEAISYALRRGIGL